MKLILARHGAVLVLLFIGIILGFTSITKHKLSGDEMLTLNIATGFGHSPLIDNTWTTGPVPPDKKIFTQKDYWARNTLSDVLKNTATYNGNMVAYNILLYYFINMTCVDDGLLRGLSALFYVISIILVYFITKKLYPDSKAAIISAGLFALNSFVLHMGHDLRGYSFAVMTTLLASLLIIRMVKDNTTKLNYKIGWTILLGILYGVSLLSHYFTMYIILGHIFYTLYCYFVLKKNIIIQVFSALFICFLFFIIWWINGGKEGNYNMEIQDRYILNMTSAQTHTSFVSLLMGTVCFINSVIGYYFQYLGYRNSSFFYLIALPLIVLLGALFFSPINKDEKKWSLSFLLIMLVSCIAFLQLCSIKSGHITSLIMTRFGAFIAPYFMIFIGYALCRLLFSNRVFPKTIAIVILSIHVILNIMCYPIPFEGYWFTYSDVKGAVEKARSEKVPPNPYSLIAKNIMRFYTEGDTVVYNSYLVSQNVNLYLRDAKLTLLQKVNTQEQKEYRIITCH